MQRREVLSFLGAAVLAPLLVPLSAEERWTLGRGLHDHLNAGYPAGRALTAAQMTLVAALADTIIPKTDIPGAIDVGVPQFVDRLIAAWYSDADGAELAASLTGFDARCQAVTGRVFSLLDPPGRDEFLTTIDGKPGEPGSIEAGYRRIKDAIVFGYLTSKPVATLLGGMPIIPGRFDGCTPVGGTR